MRDSAAPPHAPSSVRFGRVTVLAPQRRILVDGEPVALGARAFDMLVSLIERRGEVMSKRELFQAVWKGVFVGDNSLQVQVCALRKIVGASAIVTVPGRGYAFNGSIAVHPVTGTAPAGSETTAHATPEAAPLRGRSRECAALARLMSESRVVTVTGPGGIGKSRILREVLDTTHEPVARIELDQLASGESVTGSVARALDLEFGAPPTPRQVARAATGRHGTLVIENGEQQADQAAELADALTQETAMRVVCTTQVLLHSRGEHVLRLAPLAVPDDGVAEAHPGPAIELLFDAVSALNSRGAFTESEVQDAAAICRHLDGNPLAIELAAARVELLGLRGVRRRLGQQRFQLLRGNARAATAARQQSLLATMAWSWQLLTGVERNTLATLALFPGRFTLGMARRILGTRARDEWDAIQIVEGLVNKSAVLAAPGKATAFRVPESTRLYALQASGRR